MRTLTFDRPHHLAKLGEELLAVPSLRHRVVRGRLEAVFSLSGDGETLILVIPDEADDGAIDAVVQAHDPTPPPEPPAPPTLAELEAMIDAATNIAELKVAIKTMLRALARRL